ncbi:DUF2778 domain-containing protein [Enterobacter soli]|uniref:DUF2778 domain-containing protein n=1 Tax=Enterobacter soli TaxID=885040 RepID=UPI0034CEF5F9
MALHGKLILNGADYAPFNLYGVGVFMAHSGRGVHRNNGVCGAIPDSGPLPVGKYWIVDRLESNSLYQIALEIRDAVSSVTRRRQFGKSDWFALWRDDGLIDDYMWIEGLRRGNFRLHPGQASKGCITIAHNSDYAQIRNALINTPLIQVPHKKCFFARGWVEVVASGYNNKCP